MSDTESDMDSSGDSKELEALFDSIADKVRSVSRDSAPVPAGVDSVSRDAMPGAKGGAKGDDVSGNVAADAVTAVPPKIKDQMRRIAALFDASEDQAEDDLDESGVFVKEAAGTDVSGSAPAFPKAVVEQLRQIAELTGQLSNKTRKTIEALGSLYDDLDSKAASLTVRWDLLYANKISVEEFRRLASDTCAYLKNGVPQTITKVKDQVRDIVPLQDSSTLASLLAKNALLCLEEFESGLTELSRKAGE
ncbi:MAG: protein phosphatase CheZ [Candidatus Accumulibacter sp.]|jgi:chemotaxis protein CheZ|nr:protein phosphatase CheZ [Accumulibacter sp.]